MVLIFGWGQSEARDLGEVAPALCPNCHNVVALHRVRTKKSVSLYFVPVMPYGGDDYLLCPICRHGLQLTAAQKPLVETMSHATAALRHGVIAQDAYAAQVEGFWAQMGFAAYAPPAGGRAPAAPALGAGGTPAAALPPPTPAAGAGVGTAGGPGSMAGGRTTSEQLDDLARLHADGVLTDDEYRAAVKRIVGV
jgi:hypothetical protein